MSEYMDIDAVLACAQLVARSGGHDFEVGYLDDDVPVDKARWYAQASYRGARLFVDERASPDEACDALARRILGGGQCTECHRRVRIGSKWEARFCNWHRDGDAWVRGCDGKRQLTRDGEPVATP